MPSFASPPFSTSYSVVSSKMASVLYVVIVFFQCALPTVHSLVGGVVAGRNYKLCTAALRAPFICKHLLKMIIYLKPT